MAFGKLKEGFNRITKKIGKGKIIAATALALGGAMSQSCTDGQYNQEKNKIEYIKTEDAQIDNTVLIKNKEEIAAVRKEKIDAFLGKEMIVVSMHDKYNGEWRSGYLSLYPDEESLQKDLYEYSSGENKEIESKIVLNKQKVTINQKMMDEILKQTGKYQGVEKDGSMVIKDWNEDDKKEQQSNRDYFQEFLNMK